MVRKGALGRGCVTSRAQGNMSDLAAPQKAPTRRKRARVAGASYARLFLLHRLVEHGPQGQQGVSEPEPVVGCGCISSTERTSRGLGSRGGRHAPVERRIVDALLRRHQRGGHHNRAGGLAPLCGSCSQGACSRATHRGGPLQLCDGEAVQACCGGSHGSCERLKQCCVAPRGVACTVGLFAKMSALVTTAAPLRASTRPCSACGCHM